MHRGILKSTSSLECKRVNMSTDEERLEQAKKLIDQKAYDRARALLRQMPYNREAQAHLQIIDRLAPDEPEKPKSPIRKLGTPPPPNKKSPKTRNPNPKKARGNRIFFLLFSGLVLLMSLTLGVSALLVIQPTATPVPASSGPEICVVGSDTILGSALGMIDTWTQTFTETHEAQFTVAAIGSGNGVERAVSGECTHVLAMSEPMSDHQYNELMDAGIEIICAAEIGYDMVAFSTEINNPVESVTLPELADILNGEVANWQSIDPEFDRPIFILARRGSGTTDFVLRNVAHHDSAAGEWLPPNADYIVCDSNESCLEETLSTHGSLYWSSAAWLSMQRPDFLNVLSVALDAQHAPVNPLDEAGNLNTYPSPLLRPLYMYVLQSNSATEVQLELAKEFFLHVRSLDGQTNLQDHHFYPHFKQPSDIEVPLPPGFDSVGAPNRMVCKE